MFKLQNYNERPIWDKAKNEEGQEPGVRSQESGVRSQESGARSQESGVRSQESEDFSVISR